MSWRELLEFLEPLIPLLGLSAVLIAVAIVVLAVTGSLAAVEVSKYYRRQNRLLEEAEHRDPLSVTERELRGTLQSAVLEAVAPLREDLVEVKTELSRGIASHLPETAG